MNGFSIVLPIVARRALALAACAVIAVSSAFAQSSFERARALYLGASYEESLAVLDTLHPESQSERSEVALYRAFCLLALSRSDEAARTMASIISTDPTFKPSESMAAPSVLELFNDLRRSALPVIVQREYATAKVAFENGDPAAAALFDRVLTLLGDPDLVMSTKADLRLVAEGFRDLSRARAAAQDVR